MQQNLKKQLQNWLTATKQLFIERWNSWKLKRAKRTPPLSVVEALEGTIESQKEFIVYLQDELNWLRAFLKEDKIERVRNEVEFKSGRGYRSVHTKIREQVLANKAKHSPYPLTPETHAFDTTIEE
jgi:hypothetical protein